MHPPDTLPPPPTDKPVLVKVQNLCKRYTPKGDWVLQDISFEVKEGETLAIIGPSGCGKSTLLKIMAGLEDATSGHAELLDPNFTLVFQYSALFDSLTVFENVGFALLEAPDYRYKKQKFKKLPLPEIKKRVAEKLKLLGLEGTEEQYPDELSGGMQKRVSFARAIMSDPKIIFYDEPTSGLDPLASEALEDYMVRLSKQLKVASVVVTHTFSTIFRTAHRVLLLHEGRVHWLGTPAELLTSKDPVVKRFADAGLMLENPAAG